MLVGGGWLQAWGWTNRKSYWAEALEYFCCCRKHGGPGYRRSNPGLWIFVLARLLGPDRQSITTYSLAMVMAFKMNGRRRHIFLANVRDDGSPLASGMAPAREAGAGDMPEVPKAW